MEVVADTESGNESGGRVGRPPLPPGERRDRRLMFSVTERERMEVRSAADLLGVSISDLIREGVGLPPSGYAPRPATHGRP